MWLCWHPLPLWLLLQAHCYSSPTSWLIVNSQTTISFRHTWQLGHHNLEMSQKSCQPNNHSGTDLVSWWMSRISMHHSYVEWKALKAFDLVNHNLLLQKLLFSGVPHFFIKWLFSYLQHISHHVQIGTNQSSYSQLNGAMPHGSWLGPLSFSGSTP